jgi:hypothetical protein
LLLIHVKICFRFIEPVLSERITNRRFFATETCLPSSEDEKPLFLRDEKEVFILAGWDSIPATDKHQGFDAERDCHENSP